MEIYKCVANKSKPLKIALGPIYLQLPPIIPTKISTEFPLKFLLPIQLKWELFFEEFPLFKKEFPLLLNRKWGNKVEIISGNFR